MITTVTISGIHGDNLPPVTPEEPVGDYISYELVDGKAQYKFDGKLSEFQVMQRIMPRLIELGWDDVPIKQFAQNINIEHG